MDKLVCIKDFSEASKKMLDKNAAAYFNCGADDELTVQENRDAFNRWKIRPRFLRDVSNVDLTTTVFGKPVSMPIGISPTALHCMAHPEGEFASVSGADEMGTIFTLSAHSTKTIEDVGARVPNLRKWLQLPLNIGRKITLDLIERAEKSGFEALVLSIDTDGMGKRRDVLRLPFQMPENLAKEGSRTYFRSSVALPYKREKELQRIIRNNASLLKLTGSRWTIMENFKKYTNFSTWEDICDPMNYPDEDCPLISNWNLVRELKQYTKLPIILKGIQTAEDAELAVEHWASAVFVSNHGGRQIDTAMPTIEVLSEIVEAVNGRTEIFIDGGVMRGSDVFKALALGANMVFIGRPVLWGLSVGGQQGVKKVLSILKEELQNIMQLSGTPGIKDITSKFVRRLN